MESSPSEINIGTTFRIYLPRVDESASLQVKPQEAVAKGRGETILVVEDEESVRRVAAQVLTSSGYLVLEANSGPDALRLVALNREPIDLILTDMMMPGMNGRQLAQVLEEVRPGIKVLYMSGYTDDAMVHRGVFTKQLAFLQKPFSPAKLERKVREVLDQELAA